VATSRAFDEERAPEPALIDTCTHCGFCLPTCPTYDLWGEEMDSPRGRIVLMTQGLEPGSELSAEMALHFDRCLGCMACVTACPSGVRYDRLIEDTRGQVERNHRRPLGERLFRRMLWALFPHPRRLRALVPLAPAGRALGRGFPRGSRLGAMAALAPPVRLRSAWRRLPTVTPAAGERRGRIALLQGCVQRVFFGDVNRATARVLAAEGWEVHAPDEPRCCGALQLHAGDDGPARALARATIAALEDHDAVVVNAAGCGSAMKEYGHLLRDDPAWAQRAAAFSTLVRDATELLAESEPRAPRRPVELRVAYHDACHLAHAQGVRAQPRALLRAIPGVELLEPEGWETCCGSAGVYNLLQPEPAAELARRKAANVLATGADAVAAANPGCALQIGRALKDRGRPLPMFHPLELVDASIRGRRP
jgi:glycolate dehydrogenase iron-sulfur subunit